MKIKKILEITNGKLIIGKEDDSCENFCRDTRIIKPKDAYIGIKGEKINGNSLWEEAIKNGASTIILDEIKFEENEIKKYKDINIILVDDTVKALGDIATYIRTLYGNNLQVVGITGSVGKTSTKDIVSNVISQKYNTLKTEGNKNNYIGLPFTIFNLKNHEAAVIEMGMNHLGEISYLTQIAKPTIAVITNIGTSHIGNLGSRENILKAKLEILEGMEKKVLVINNDNDLLHKYYLNNKDIEIHTYGVDNDSELMAKNILLHENNSEFTCEFENENVKINVPVGGIHFVYNALCSIMVGKLMGLNINQIKKGIETFELTKNRMEVIEMPNEIKIINDSYNASFESMQAALRNLGGFKNKRKIAVLGDMFELGDFSKELHEKVGYEVVDNNIDILICCGENAKYIISSAKEKGMKKENIYYFKDKEKIVECINTIKKQSDCILFKASNGMRFFDIVDKIVK